MVASTFAFHTAKRKEGKAASLLDKKKTEDLNWKMKTFKVAKPTTKIAQNVNLDDKDPKNFHYIYALVKN